MFYVKFKNDEIELKADITDENVFTTCPACGKEHAVDIVELFSNGETCLYSTQVYCPECSAKHMAEKQQIS